MMMRRGRRQRRRDARYACCSRDDTHDQRRLVLSAVCSVLEFTERPQPPDKLSSSINNPLTRKVGIYVQYMHA